MPHLTRRTLFASAAVMAGGAALAQSAPPARTKGPAVWLDLDQKELDDAYDQSVYAPNLRQITGRYVTNSEAVRARIGAPKRFAYGSTPIEGLDLYAAKTPNAPVQVFIHGGAWRGGLAKDFATPAEMFVEAGAHLVVLDFNNVIETKGDLMPMARQVRNAVGWVYKNAASFGGDPNRLYVSGHSSGGHLAGVVLTTDWGKDFGLPRDILKGVVCCSGMFDLKPAQRICAIHRRDGACAQPAAPSRAHQLPGDAGLWHIGDAGIPAAVSRLRGSGAGRRQAGAARRRAGLQSLRGQ
jgi:arylformamidase